MRLLFGLLCTMGALLPAQAQDQGAPVITNYGPEQYKAGSQNWVTVQDRRGVMYFGNSMGVLEFDGQRWQLIPTAATVRALASGPEGTIYYGSVGDLGYLASSPTGKVSAVSLREAIPPTDRAFNDVWQLESGADGIYFLTRSKIFRFHDGRITALPGKFASSQACVLDGTLFYADLEKGICLVDGDRVVPVPALAGVYDGRRITLARFGHHELLVGRMSGDFLRIDLSAFWDETSQRYVPARPAPKEMVKGFPNELGAFLREDQAFIYKLLPLGSDTFAISTVKAGILTFDRSGKLIRAINKSGGLLDNTVTGILLDRSNDLWATTNAGISHIELSVPQSIFRTGTGVDAISISACFHDGRLYVGTFQSLLVQAPYRFTLKDDVPRFRVLQDSPTEIWQLLEVQGDLMAASGAGLFQIRGDAAFKVPGSSPSNLCLGVSRRWPGHLFVGRLDGLEVFRRTSDHWTLVGRMDGVKENIRRITEDVSGDLWLNTDARGLLRAHFYGGKPTGVVVHRFGPENGLPGLTRLRTSSYGRVLYVCSPQGLFRADIQPWDTGTSEQISFAPDLTMGKVFTNPPPALNDMISDGKGGFIFSTSEGAIWAFPGKDGHFQMTDRPFNGLASPDDALYVHPNGGVWLLGRELHRVDLWAPKDYEQGFEVLIRKVVDKARRPVFLGTHGREGSGVRSSRTVFCSAQGSEDVPDLPYSDNALSIEFSASFYEKPGTIQFQYLLEGFEKDWSEWQRVAFKEYTNIPEGKYRFRVRARNIYGTVGNEAAYSLRILPPWYRTIWAYIFWVVGGGGALAGIIFIFTLNLRRQKRHLENVVAERTQQLHEATLTDPLTGLRNRRFVTEILHNDAAAFVGVKNHLLAGKNQRHNMPEDTVFGLFLLDIDHFKKVNDTYGHDAGDHVLKQFAAVLARSVRLDDAVMRVGGEEFLVVLKNTKAKYLPVFAAKILAKVAATPFDLGDGKTIRKTCSLGYNRFPLFQEQPGLITLEQGIMVADLGLLHAKSHGRRRAVCLMAGPNAPSGQEVIQQTVTSLEFALREGFLQIGDVSNNPSNVG